MLTIWSIGASEDVREKIKGENESQQHMNQRDTEWLQWRELITENKMK